MPPQYFSHPLTTPELSSFLSSKFRFWSFISMVLLVFVHGYNLHIRYLQPWTLPGEPLTGTSFLEYFLANGLLRFRIPMLFIISGFLYALHDYRPYRSFTWKRFKTLIIPYLIWSALGLAFTYGLELTHYGRGIIAGSGVVQIDDQRMLLHDYHWYEMLGRWILLPVPYQLWFIRVLFIYNLAYPLIRWCVLHRIVRWIFFTVAVVMWLGTMSFILVEGEGLLFFSLGVWIRKTQFNIESPGRRWRPLWWGIAFAGIAGVKTILAFKGQPVMGNSVYFVLLILHKLMVLSGLIFCWFGLDRWVTWCMSKKWFIWLSAFAFMIYAMHAPLVAYAINPVLGWFHYLPATRLISYFLLPLAVISLCIVTGEILRRLLPGIYTHLTGGRGVVKK